MCCTIVTYSEIKSHVEVAACSLEKVELINKQNYVQKKPRSLDERIQETRKISATPVRHGATHEHDPFR